MWCIFTPAAECCNCCDATHMEFFVAPHSSDSVCGMLCPVHWVQYDTVSTNSIGAQNFK